MSRRICLEGLPKCLPAQVAAPGPAGPPGARPGAFAKMAGVISRCGAAEDSPGGVPKPQPIF